MRILAPWMDINQVELDALRNVPVDIGKAEAKSAATVAAMAGHWCHSHTMIDAACAWMLLDAFDQGQFGLCHCEAHQ